MILRIFLLTAAVLTHQLHGRPTGHNPRTSDDDEGKYRFVVALINKVYQEQKHRCTGTLILPNWVLTSAKCLIADSQVQFDELDLPINETNSIRRVLSMQRPLGGTGKGPDLGLMFVNAIPMKEYGQLSAVDYKTIVGHVVVFAGFGPGEEHCTECGVGPVQIGEGMLSSCNADENKKILFAPMPSLCVAPKCSQLSDLSSAGEPGSPVFHGGKLVGVHVGDARSGSMRSYTPVSPYLSWIQQVVTKPELLRSGIGGYAYSEAM